MTLTLTETFQMIEACPETQMTERQKKQAEYLVSRGYVFLVHFWLHTVDRLSWQHMDIELKGAKVQ